MRRSALFALLALAPLASSCGLDLSSLGSAEDEGKDEDAKNKPEGEAPTDEEALATSGFALHPGDQKYEKKGGRTVSRFVIQLLDAEDGPVVGAKLTLKRLGSKEEEYKVIDKVTVVNPGSNVFTALISAGKEYELTVAKAGFGKNSKSIVFDAAKAVDVAFPFVVELAEAGEPPAPEPDVFEPGKPQKPLPDERPDFAQAGLKFCDVRGGETDFDDLLRLISEREPEQYSVLKEKFLADGGRIHSCRSKGFGAFILRLRGPNGEKGEFAVKSCNFSDHYYGPIPAIACADVGPLPPPPPAMPDEPAPLPPEAPMPEEVKRTALLITPLKLDDGGKLVITVLDDGNGKEQVYEHVIAENDALGKPFRLEGACRAGGDNAVRVQVAVAGKLEPTGSACVASRDDKEAVTLIFDSSGPGLIGGGNCVDEASDEVVELRCESGRIYLK